MTNRRLKQTLGKYLPSKNITPTCHNQHKYTTRHMPTSRHRAYADNSFSRVIIYLCLSLCSVTSELSLALLFSALPQSFLSFSISISLSLSLFLSFSFSLFVHQSTMAVSFYILFCLFVCLFGLSVCVSICYVDCIILYLLRLLICLFRCMFVCVFVRLFLCLFIFYVSQFFFVS